MPVTRPSSPLDEKVPVLSAFKGWMSKVIADISPDSEAKDPGDAALKSYPNNGGSDSRILTSDPRGRFSPGSVTSDFADTLDDISIQFDETESTNDDAFEQNSCSDLDQTDSRDYLNCFFFSGPFFHGIQLNIF